MGKKKLTDGKCYPTSSKNITICPHNKNGNCKLKTTYFTKCNNRWR